MAGSQLKITTNGKAKKVTYSVFHNSWNCYYDAFFHLCYACWQMWTSKHTNRSICSLLSCESCTILSVLITLFRPDPPTGTNWPAPSFTPAGSSSKDQAQRKKIAVYHLLCSWLSVPKTLSSKQDGNPLRQFT